MLSEYTEKFVIEPRENRLDARKVNHVLRLWNDQVAVLQVDLGRRISMR